MPHASVSRRVAAPLPVVWQVFTDVPTATRRIAGVSDVEMLSSYVSGLGTRWRETRTVYGRTSTEEFEVVDYEREHRYVVTSRGRGARYRTQYTFDALGTDATTVLAVFTVRGNTMVAGMVGVVVWPVTRRTVRKVLAQDVDDLAAAAEREVGEPL
ncbi:MAG: SRPBCC family protein [Actinomycetes bacterium]